jgi:hypothetical protein
VISVLEPPSPGGSWLTYDPCWAEYADAIRAEAQRQLDELLAELGEIASGEVVVGDPANELSYAANELDLLVTGARDYGPFRRVMLGSTSSKLVHRAPCPVLVLTRTAIDEDEPSGATQQLRSRLPGELTLLRATTTAWPALSRAANRSFAVREAGDRGRTRTVTPERHTGPSRSRAGRSATVCRRCRCG